MQIDAADNLKTLLRRHNRALLIGMEREYLFDSERDWRFDLAWPSLHIAVEVDGATHWRGRKRGVGRHSSPEGIAADNEKLNAALIAGWRVYRVTTERLARDPLGVIEDLNALIGGGWNTIKEREQ